MFCHASTWLALTIFLPEVWQYQSHGHCGDICRAEDFAFAIVQDHKCWCSDYTPADSTVVEDDECDIGCPGFDEICGGKNLFSYLYLNKKPLGAMEASVSTPSRVVYRRPSRPPSLPLFFLVPDCDLPPSCIVVRCAKRMAWLNRKVLGPRYCHCHDVAGK